MDIVLKSYTILNNTATLFEVGDLSRIASETLGDFLRKWGIPAILRPRINTVTRVSPGVFNWPLWSPVYKKDDPYDKKNYRPITVQVIMNNVFEQLLSRQLGDSFSDKLNVNLTAYM